MMITEPGHTRVVEPGPGHIDLGNGAYAADVHLDLDLRDDGPDSQTVAELHLGLAHHDPEVGEDVEDVAAVSCEMTLVDLQNLRDEVTSLIALIEARS